MFLLILKFLERRGKYLVNNMIHIFYRAANFKESNDKCRPPFFNLEKCFKNLLDTLDNRAQLTVMFDGDLLSYDSFFIKKYQLQYQFKVQLINAGSDFKSNNLTCEYIKNNQDIKDDDIVYLLEQDYLHIFGWIDAILDLYQCNPNYKMNETYISNYCHKDKYLFKHKDRNDCWGIYYGLKSEVYLTNHRFWQTVPSTCRSFLIKKTLFDKDYEILSSLDSDNIIFPKLTKLGREIIQPLTGLSTHCHSVYLSPFVNWEKISDDTKLL